MKSLKKTGGLLLVTLLSAATALTGCGGGSGNSEATASPAASAAATAAASDKPASEAPKTELKPYELRLVFPGTPQKDQQAVNDEINKYLKDKINATIKIEPIQWGQWDNKVNLLIASREKVDIMFTAQWTNYAVNVGKGAFLPLNDPKSKNGDLLQKAGKDILAGGITPDILKGSAINGINYGVPTLKEMASQGGVIYRADIAQELGLDDKLQKAQKIEDLVPILAEVKAKKPELTALFMRDGENFNTHYFSNFEYLGDTNIPGIIFKDGKETKVVSALDTDRYKNNVKIAREMMTKGLINKDAATTQLSTNDAMKSGKVFMIPAPLKPGKDAEVAAAVGLVGKLKQVALNVKTTATSEAAGSMLAISSTSGDPERAMMFINLLHTDKYLNNLLNFGIENVHYKKAGANNAEPSDRTADYSPGATWQFGSQFLNYIWKGEPADKWEQFKTFNNGSLVSPGLGFTFDSHEQIKTKVAAALAVRKEYDPGLDTGSMDPETALPKYIDKLKKAGLDDIIAEKQKQFDAFLQKK